MVLLLIFLICFSASVIGAICGIGGGVIIKPVLDAFGIMDVAGLLRLNIRRRAPGAAACWRAPRR